MRILSYAATALMLSTAAAAAAEPTGEWLVKDKLGTIRIENCGGSLWGVIASEQAPGVDSNNPDPRKRSRPTLGMPILLGLKPTRPNRWEGEIYNPQDGRNYSAKVTMSDGNPNVLELEGCVLGFLCGGEQWTRVAAKPEARGGKPEARGGKPAPAKSVCASIAEARGR